MIIETMRRHHKWSASRIAFELEQSGRNISRHTVTRLLAHLGLNRRATIDPSGATNRKPQRIVAERPGHMAYIDVNEGRTHPERRCRFLLEFLP